MFVEKQCDVAVSAICLFVCLSLFKPSTVPADFIQVQMEGELIFVWLNDLLIDCFFTELTQDILMLYM